MTGGEDRITFRKPRSWTVFPKAHVVGQASPETKGVQKMQPVDPLVLIWTELGLEPVVGFHVTDKLRVSELLNHGIEPFAARNGTFPIEIRFPAQGLREKLEPQGIPQRQLALFDPVFELFVGIQRLS